ncbi:hypothetical protein BT96DRAFT_1009083 [Gymnopus androsaceus JB14]|uniref:G-protein coupled receptors family 1 profile domain-containing protein n=1 Tax=Gymnopus androsaceus JB14 TaxID=1447944 RepID=A0A6A4GDD5_9AGAR|nr:hypothetical protein BT96DRAFT_1009083 [Gymnopus androsaceus JB14]
MSFSVRQAQIIGLFVETLFYGMHIITFGVCLRCLFWDSSGALLASTQVKRGLLVMSLALFIISTLDMALAVVNDYNGLVSPGGQDTLNTPNWLTVSRVVFLGTQNIIGDSIWVYRCWIIYNRRWSVIAVPSLLFFAVLGISFTIAGLEPETVPGPLPKAGKTTLMIAIVYCISFVSSLLTTVLIVHRLWRVERDLHKQASKGLTSADTPQNLRDSQRQGRSRLGQVMLLVIESGIMFTTTEFLSMIAFFLKSNMCYIATYTDIQVIPIAFNLIVIRLSLAKDENFEEDMSRSWAVAVPPNAENSWSSEEGSRGMLRSRSRGSSTLPLEKIPSPSTPNDSLVRSMDL